MRIERVSPGNQYELDHTRSGTDLPCLADPDHDVKIDYLSECEVKYGSFFLPAGRR